MKRGIRQSPPLKPQATMMNFDRSIDTATPLDWVSSTEDLSELKIDTSDIFLDQTPDGELETTVQDVVTGSDAEETGSRKRSCEDRPRSRAQRRKKKPSGLPKRPLSAYNIFFQEERLKIQQEDENRLGFNDYGKIIGIRWKELSEDERKKYNELAQEDTLRYRNEMDAIKELNKRAKEEEGDKESCNKKLNPLPWLTSSSEAANPGLPKESISSPMPIRPPLSGPHAYSETQRLNHSQSGELLNTSRGHLPAASHYGTQPGFPVPPGMEIMLPDVSGRERKYTVRYSVYSMRREDAESFINSFSGAVIMPGREYRANFPDPQCMMNHQTQGPPQYSQGRKYEYQR